MQIKRSITPHAEKSYLDRLQFDPKLWGSVVAKYITNIRIVLLLVLTIVLMGTISFLNLPRRLNPEIKIPIVTVVTVLPGAGPEDMESLVTIPIENKLRGLTGLDQITSSSQDNVSAITLQFFSTVSQDKAKDDVQSAVDTVSGLPDDAQTPSVAALDFENQPIWTFAITQKDDDVPSLMRFADDLKNKLEDDPKVDRVAVSGFETQEIVVEADAAKIRQYNLNPLLLAGAVKAAVHSIPSGTVDTSRNTFSLTVDPSIASIEDLRRLRLTVGTSVIQLGDVAIIAERAKPLGRAAYLADPNHDPRRIITMNVYKLSSAKINEAADSAAKIVDESIKSYNGRFTVVTILNTAHEVSKQFTDLLGEFRSTIILVFACLFLFLGLRQAIISSLTVPLTFLSAFIFMQVFGMSINFLSLFAFLLALGLLIDDTIVTVSAMTTYYKTGKFTPGETGLLVWRDTIVPIWSTTITTIWSFLPLLLSTGIIGEFIKPIPVVITVTMLSSTAIAVLITLPFMIVLLKPVVAHRVVVLLKIIAFLASLGVLFTIAAGNPFLPLITLFYIAATAIFLRVYRPLTTYVKKRVLVWKPAAAVSDKLHTYSNHGVLDIELLAEKYHRLILRVLGSASARRTVVIAIVTYSVVGFLLIPFGLVKNEFFPKSDVEEVFVSLELPSGSTLETTQSETRVLLEDLRKSPNSDFTVAEIGRGIGSFGFSDNTNNAVLFTIHLPAKENRRQSSMQIAQSLRDKYKNYSKGTIQVVEESGGPPAGADVQIKLLGDDLAKLDQYADTIVEHLKSQSGLTNITKSIKPGTSAIVFEPDLQKLAAAGLDMQTLGIWLRTYASGFTLDDVNFTNKTTDKRDIVFRFSAMRPDAENISAILIPTPSGAVPLASLGSLRSKANPTIITREAGKRTISVSAAVTPGFNVAEKNTELLNFVKTMGFDPGYSSATGGVNEENQKSVTSILQAMVVAAILILVTMVIQFHSYRQAVIVLIVIPLAVSSVFYAFALTGTPLSFPALIGVLSLFGIVVTNSMFIVDKINLNQKQGMPFKEAIADAGASRLEPIILTKLCTVLGLLPVTLSNPLWRGLGGAIISGLLLASSIMLLFIPVIYYQWFNGNSETNKAKL